MKILGTSISFSELLSKSSYFGDTFLKAVVDIEKEVIAIDAEMHFDLEQFLLDQGSVKQNLWGVNFLKNPDQTFAVQFDA